MTGSKRHYYNASTVRAHVSRTDDGFLGVITALDQNVGLKVANEFERRILVKRHHCVHQLERAKHDGALRRGSHRTRRPLEPAHGFIGVDRDHERISLVARGIEKVHVPGMQQVENTIGEYHAAMERAAPLSRGGPVHKLPSRVRGRLDHMDQNLLSANGENSIVLVVKGRSNTRAYRARITIRVSDLATLTAPASSGSCSESA